MIDKSSIEVLNGNFANTVLGVVLLEDCLTTMGKLTNNSVDLIITSPPYNKAGYEGFIRKRHEKDSWSKGRNIEYGGEADNDFMVEAEYQEQQIKVLNEMHRIKNGKQITPYEWLLKSEWTLKQEVVWFNAVSYTHLTLPTNSLV